MSTTYSLVCHETKLKLWIGQGSSAMGMSSLYTFPEARLKLTDFLNMHQGQPLVFVSDYTIDSWEDGHEYEEFGE